jgi:hypothetical protein
MKGKFKLFGHIGLALFLVSVLVLTLAPVAQAATAVTEVWVEFDDETDSMNSVSLTTNEYIIHFKPTTALVRGVDYVTVTFPDGTTEMGGGTSAYAFSIGGAPAAADLEFSTDYGTAATSQGTWKRASINGTYGGYRIKVKCPFDYAAGSDVWLKVSSTNITAAATAGDSYKVKVSTTKDTTAVLSSAFSLGHATDVLQSISTSVAPATAGAAGQYTITFTPATTLDASSGTITVRFPVGTVLPSSMTASNVEVKEYGGSFTACGVTPTVDADRRLVTVTTPIELDADDADQIRFLSAAGIVNPTIADDSGDYFVGVRTSGDREWVIADAVHEITAGAATKLAVANGEIGKATDRYSDDATMINMYSSQIYVMLADANGNGVTPASAVTVTPSSSSSTGSFYKPGAVAGTGTMTQVTSITVNNYDPYSDTDQIVCYKDSTAGTHTLTFSASGYTSATWTVTIAPAISLYDGNDALVNTYGASSTTPASETSTSYAGSAAKYGSDYINDAITAALAGDTVKLGDGIYEVDNDSYISLNKKVTLTSVNGASSTTIRNTEEINYAILVGVDGTAATPVIIDGLTFQRLRSGGSYDIDSAIRNVGGYDYVTVRNNIFNNIEPDANSSVEGVIWFTSADDITSATVSNNTFNSCVTAWPDISGSKSGSIVFDTAHGGNGDFSGVTISGNTLTDCGQYGIVMGGNGGGSAGPHTVTISNNTITNGQSAIVLCDYFTLALVTGNTITAPYERAIQVEGDNNASVKIKNNTISDSANASSGSDATRGAIRVTDEATAGAVVVQYNDITGSKGYAIEAGSSAAAVDAKYNYYGSATGPAYTALTGATVGKSNPNGTGDSITDRVTYYPWLHKSRADVVADNASYQTSVMQLVSGWNTMSTPVELISTADSIDELIPSGMTIGYYYDGGWQQITTGYVLSPCDAVYVKMSESKYVQFKFDAAAFTTPSKELDAGWNLISLASLDSDGMEADDAVASVYLTAANLPGYGQVVSPSINPTQYDMYYNAGTSWAVARSQHATSLGTSYHMYAGLGYWIYMQNAATLAGFEITPIAPDLD